MRPVLFWTVFLALQARAIALDLTAIGAYQVNLGKKSYIDSSQIAYDCGDVLFAAGSKVYRMAEAGGIESVFEKPGGEFMGIDVISSHLVYLFRGVEDFIVGVCNLTTGEEEELPIGRLAKEGRLGVGANIYWKNRQEIIYQAHMRLGRKEVRVYNIESGSDTTVFSRTEMALLSFDRDQQVLLYKEYARDGTTAQKLYNLRSDTEKTIVSVDSSQATVLTGSSAAFFGIRDPKTFGALEQIVISTPKERKSVPVGYRFHGGRYFSDAKRLVAYEVLGPNWDRHFIVYRVELDE